MKNKYIYFIIILAVIRIIFGTLTGVWFAESQAFDDALLANYSMLPEHFLNPNVYSLVKTISYPIFNNICFILGIKYSTFLSIFWVIDALFVSYIIYKLTGKKNISLLSYVYVLFHPMAFDLWLGTRLYRNSIIAPFVLLTICLIIRKIYSLKDNINYKNEICKQILLGIVFSFTFYIKEDGIWLLACLLLSMIIELFYLIKKIKIDKLNRRKSFLLLVIFIIPLFIFILYTNAYKTINHKFFGVYEIETKSNGELGKFVNNIYKIESKKRTSVYWAPEDAISKAYSVSPNFKNYPELKDNIIHSEWFGGDIKRNPIKGDFLTWVLRTSLSNTGVWKSEKQVNNLFKNINNDIEIAFKNGQLKKDDRIQLLSSAGGRTIHEIFKLGKFVIKSYGDTILLNGYRPGAQYGDSGKDKTTKYYSKILDENYLKNEYRDVKEIKAINKLIEILFILYKVINVLLIIILVINILINIKKEIVLFLNKKVNLEVIKYFLILLFTSISFMYTFSICWFTEFIHIDYYDSAIQNFYVIALPILLIFPFFLSLDMIINNKKINKIKNNKLFVQIFKFGIVGGIATVIDWLVYYILFNFFKINPLIANIGAFGISVIYNYIASVKWVFDVNENISKKKIFSQFIIFSIIGLLITELIIYFGVDLFKMNPMLIKIVATAITMVFNFVTRKIFLER